MIIRYFLIVTIIIFASTIIINPLISETSAQTTKDLTISIPKDTGTPGCEKKKSCFKPYEAKIKKNTLIRWINNDNVAHTATSGKITKPDTAGTVFDTGLLLPGKSYLTTIRKSGTYDYFCMVHPWMIGKIKVS